MELVLRLVLYKPAFTKLASDPTVFTVRRRGFLAVHIPLSQLR